jgi:hypothetical protein
MIWSSMIQRCCNPHCREFKYYGGRGIRVCERWLEAQGFANFYADLGPQPFPRAGLHRVDNDGHYEPGNVIWATPHTQSRHRRSNRILTYGGCSLILTDWAVKVGMKPVTLKKRLRKGWSVEEALTRPVEPRQPYAQWVRWKPIPGKRGPKPRSEASPAAPTV